jgi:peptidylamidoglycolate lyase
VEKEDSTSQKFTRTNPTDVAVAPNGDIYIVDGYGSQIVRRFDKSFRHLKTIGRRSPKPGKDADHGPFYTCHGVWVNTLRRSDPEIYIADRHDGRIEVFDLELNYKRTLPNDVRYPCCCYQYKGHLYIPDLASRVTILDVDDKLAAHLGDGKKADGKTNKLDNKTNPTLLAAPHVMCVDSHGDLYVVEWLDFCLPKKFKHTPA